MPWNSENWAMVRDRQWVEGKFVMCSEKIRWVFSCFFRTVLTVQSEWERNKSVFARRRWRAFFVLVVGWHSECLHWPLTSAFNLSFRILSHLSSLFRLNQGSILQRSFGQADPLSICLPQLIFSLGMSMLVCVNAHWQQQNLLPRSHEGPSEVTNTLEICRGGVGNS